MEAWTPVLTNIALLIIATVHCLVCIISIYHLSKRICPCFRAKQAYDHNQFDPTFRPVQQFVVSVDEVKKGQDVERVRNHELCKELEVKLQGETIKKKKVICFKVFNVTCFKQEKLSNIIEDVFEGWDCYYNSSKF